MTERHTTLLLILLTLAIPSCGAQSIFPETPPPSEGKLEVKETSLGRMVSAPEDIKVSPDQRRVAFKVKRGDKELVVVDGKEGQSYDFIEHGPTFSPDSRRIAYTARRKGLQFIVVDGIEGKGYEPWDNMYPIFSPDSKRIAFMARRDNGTMMVIDGVEGKPYRTLDTQSPPDVFSPDSKRFGYAAEIGKGQWVAVVDGVEGKTYDYVDNVQFSPDSRRVLYQASCRGVSCVVVDDVEGPEFNWIYLSSPNDSVSTHFSPDSKRVAYEAHPKSVTSVMVVDGKVGREYENIECFSRIFSPDSKHTVYTAKNGTKVCVVLDGEEGSLFDDTAGAGMISRMVTHPYFSSDGKHMAYAVRRNGQIVTICDGKEIAKGDVVFSPDWQHMAYVASRGWGWMVVRDGKEGPQHFLGETWRTQLFFSPDSQRMAYRASQSRQIEFVVVDGIQSIRYQLVDVGNPIFSPDSKHVAYWAAPASGKWHVFVDNAYSGAYDEPVHGSKLGFDGPKTLHALAVRSGEMFLVEITILAP